MRRSRNGRDFSAHSESLDGANNDVVCEAARARSTSGEAVIATDPLGRILYWDEEAAKLYGWSEAEVIGRNIVDITPPIGLRAEASQIMRQLRSGESWTGIFEVHDRHDTRFFVEVTDSPIFTENGKLVGIIGVSRAVGGKSSGR